MIDDLASVPLTTKKLGRPLHVVEETASTMDDVRSLLAGGAGEGVVVVADAQTNGRGTHGRSWESPRGSDLYVSVGLRPALPLEHLGFLALASGLAVADVVDARLGRGVARVKWPNDVLVEGAKIAGVLVESRSTADRVEATLGIGLNVNRTEFPDALAATSLYRSSSTTHPRAAVLAELLLALETRLDGLADGLDCTLRALTHRLAYLGRSGTIGDTRGVVRGIDPSGGLALEVAGRVEVHLAGRFVPDP